MCCGDKVYTSVDIPKGFLNTFSWRALRKKTKSPEAVSRREMEVVAEWDNMLSLQVSWELHPHEDPAAHKRQDQGGESTNRSNKY